MTAETTFIAPTKPYTVAQAYDRSAAAKGSPTLGRNAAFADYNGHRITVEYLPLRGYYVATYQWAGNRTIARGMLAPVLREAIRFYNRQGAGASLTVRVQPTGVNEAVEIGGDLLRVRTDEAVAADMRWFTWRHKVAARSAPDHARGQRERFDLDLLLASATEDDYRAALRAAR